MPIEQIFKVSPTIDGGSQLETTPNARKVLTDENFYKLLEAKPNVYLLETEKLVAYIKTVETCDCAGRRGEKRHILLASLWDCIRIATPIITRYFSETLDPPTDTKLESITLPLPTSST